MKAKIVSVTGLPREVARQVVGGWALAWDSALEVVRAPGAFVVQVERRGLDVEKSIADFLRSMQQNRTGGWQRVRAGAMRTLRWTRQEATDSSQYAEGELERQVERVLERMGIPTRDRLERLGREIDSLTQRIEGELARMAENDLRLIV